ncbi:MAG: prolyl oligopeptidase family serine peptidase [Rhodobiaceae bacterium]|nr:prolyl oligopeptidase family serine peptidase [Rhodobiaceae bacterium]
MVLDLDGPRMPPANGRPARRLVIFLHGYGADGNDLIALGQQWAQILPDTAFVSPDAPEPCGMPGAAGGRQWFPLTFRDPNEYWRGVSQAGPVLDRFIDRERDRLGLSDADVALVGFSQGTMMALHVGLRRAQRLGAIVGYSGALAGGEHLKDELTQKPPLLLIHGDRDDVLPVQMLFMALQALADAGMAAEFHVSSGIGHGIDGEGLRMGGHFLASAFSAPR